MGRYSKSCGQVPQLEALEPRLLLAADVIITEFMANNTSGLKDAEGDRPDWIEIYNPGTDLIDLTGWHLTDNSTKPDKWHFPDGTTLEPNAHLVVFASDKNTVISGEIHTNFKLNDEGEYLAITRPDKSVAYEYAPTFPPQEQNISYGIRENTVSTTLVPEDAAARILVPGDGSLGTAWIATSFDDSSWVLNGPTAIGFEEICAPQGYINPYPGSTFFYGPYGPGGTYNLYELVTSTKTWKSAYDDAKTRSQGGKTGHLVTISSAAENEFVRSMLPGTAWIGLTDSTTATFLPLGTYEAGNTSGDPLPPAGEEPETGERGRGFKWINGDAYTYQNWHGGEPADTAPGQDGVEMTADGAWYDNANGESGQTGVTRAYYVVEYDQPIPYSKLYYGPYGANGTTNLYEVVTSSRTWLSAYNDAKARTQGGRTGHLVTISSAAENEFVKSLITQTSWIGLTDSTTSTFSSLGTYEAGNTSGDPPPQAGQEPGATERGRGFKWVNGDPYTYQNWHSGEPGDTSPGEDGTSLAADGTWYDAKNGETGQTGLNLGAYVVEYDMPRKFFYGPFGPDGSWNLYEVVTGSKTWLQAKTEAALKTQGGKTGHLATLTSAAENTFARSLISGTAWIGLTDSATFGGTEAGNAGGLPLPPTGEVPEAGERGYGFVWVTGEAFTYQNWKTGEPNDNSGAAPGEDGVELSTDGTWNDAKIGEGAQTGKTNNYYIVEYDQVAPGPCFTLLEAQSPVALSDISQAIAMLASADTTAYSTPVINFADPEKASTGRFGANLLFGTNTGADDNNFAVKATATVKIPASGSWTFDVASDDGFQLKIDGAAFTQATNVSGSGGTYSGDTLRRLTGAGETLGVATLSAGEHAIELYFYEGIGNSGLELSAAPGSYSSVPSVSPFRPIGDTLNSGLAIRGLGDEVATNIQTAMQGANASAYIRIPFTVTNPADADRLLLRIQYDDGFVAYLNGVKVASANAPATPAWNSAATATRPYYAATTYQELDLSLYRAALVAGNNVLAIQGLNVAAGDADFLLSPQLESRTITGTDLRYFTTPSPGRPNNQSVVALVTDTHFSTGRGFFTRAFDLTLTCDTPGTTIYYTTDSSTPSATHGTVYSTPILVDRTTTLRAKAYKPEWEPSNVDTCTYLFVADVIGQSPTGQAPAGWPAGPVNGQILDYGMDPDVVNDLRYRDLLDDALLAIPSISIVTDLPYLFDATTGIYTHANMDGEDWERPTSVELLYPDGSAGFQIDCGLRIRGGYSRSGQNPKHAFRLLFKSEYGAGELHYPLFGDEGVDAFDNIDLRTSQNYSWSYAGDSLNIMVRDIFNRDTQGDMGQPYTRGRFYHLYIDGQYWGLYQTEERPEASYAESYFGGNEEHYDVVKVTDGYTVFATDGNLTAWDELWDAAMAGFTTDEAYYRVLGLNPDGTRNPAYAVQVDPDNLIDYMISIYYSGDLDAPISNFLSNLKPNNFYGIRDRTGDEGWQFLRHDGEHTLRYDSGELTRDRTGPFTAGDQFQYFNPQFLHQKLMAHPEYRLHFADHVQRYFFNGGLLTPEANIARFMQRINEINLAIIAESARWGDSKTTVPKTRDDDWLPTVNGELGTYFPQRSDIVLNQFRAKGWYPSLAAATFSQRGGTIPYLPPYFNLTLSAPAGTIYYTLDGTDPRLRDGSVAPGAQGYSGAIELTDSTLVRARVFDGSTWSALEEAAFVTPKRSALRITEILYHPAPPQPDPSPESVYLEDDFQFIEFQNTLPLTVNLNGIRLTEGVDFTFPNVDLAPGGRILVVANQGAFTARYGTGYAIAGAFTGNLAHAGERLQVDAGLGGIILDFHYKDGWYDLSDGQGYSLVVRNAGQATSLWDSSDGWRPSWQAGGNPGAADPGINPNAIVINEVVAHQDLDNPGDWIELKNTTGSSISIAGWYLSDDPLNLMKYRIPDATPAIPAGGCAVFNEYDHFGAAFALDELGDTVCLSASPSPDVLAGYRESETFGASDRGYGGDDVAGVAFTRYIKSTGGKDFAAESARTPGTANAYPLVGPVVINEILYSPVAGRDEYIELLNLSGADVPFYAPDEPGHPDNPWKFTDGIAYSFPTDSTSKIPANGYALVVGIDPAIFRTKYGIPLSVPIFGPYTGVLSNDGESIELCRPGEPEPDGTVPYYRVDKVTYNDKAPWPARADGGGSPLIRLVAVNYGNDVANWAAGTTDGTPGAANAPLDATPPTVPTGLTATAASPSQIDLAWAASSDPESGLDHYTLYRNDILIAVSATNSYSDTNALPGVAYAYQVSATNIDDAESARSASVTGRIVTLLSVAPSDTTALRVAFSETLDQASAETKANYAITFGTGQTLAISQATLDAGKTTVTLTLSTPMVFDTIYTLTARSVVGLSGFVTAPGSTRTFYYYVEGSGTLFREWWTDVTGSAVSNLTSSTNYPNNPTGRDERTIFEGPTNWAENYGTRLRGYVTAPLTGNYTFWIASDDNSDLYLSTDENPANKTRIAWVGGWTNSQEWTREANQRSGLIALQAGRRYYIEVLQKEGAGGDNVAVGWQLPGGTYERPIPGFRLSSPAPTDTYPWWTPDMTVSLTAPDPDASEAGTDKGQFRITRTGNLTPALTVYYTVSGTASPDDYTQVLSGAATISAGASYVNLDVTPINDALCEEDETVILTLDGGHPTYLLGDPVAATVTLVDNEYPLVTAVKLNGRAERGPGSINPSAIGIQTLVVTFSEPVLFDRTGVTLQTYPAGTTVTPLSLSGSGTDTMTVILADGTPEHPYLVDTWVKVRLSGSGTIKDLANHHRLDGEAKAGGSGRGYIYDAADLPTGDGTEGGDAVFFVGSLRGDMDLDRAMTAADKAAFAAKWRGQDLDADFRGVGFGTRPPDARITTADINGFTSVYQRAQAMNLHLDELPATLGSQAAGVVALPPVSSSTGSFDILAAAAGWIEPAGTAPLRSPAVGMSGAASLTAPASAFGREDWGSDPAAREPDAPAVKSVRPLRLSDSPSSAAVLRLRQRPPYRGD